MYLILKREVKNYIKRPLFWIGIAVVVLMVFLNVRPYLDIHYLAEGENIVNDYPEIFRDGDVFEGYVPTKEELRREVWEEQIQETLISVFQMNHAQAQSLIDEMHEMDIMAACKYLEKYNFYSAYAVYVDTAYHKGTPEEINSFIAERLESKTFSYYFSRKFADFAGLFMGFFATVLLAALFMQDTRKNIYELLHTKPVSAGNYLLGKVGGGFAVCLIILAVLNLIFWVLCSILTKSSGFEVRLTDFILATCIYILPNMLMIISIYSLISLLFKNPLPAVPLLLLYMVYSNMGSRNAQGIYGYYGRPLAIMVRFPGTFFDTAPPPMVLLNQSFLILASACILFISMQIWKRRRVY
ncbi:MAG: ABC transporter permease subunit [Lachnospiraceae bacterium]|nr:ABC transporter permease subunit [Lachnospiraceae bacterium]